MSASVDQQISVIIDRFGIPETLAALCREVNKRGFGPVFNRLNRVYEWMTKDNPK